MAKQITTKKMLTICKPVASCGKPQNSLTADCFNACDQNEKSSKYWKNYPNVTQGHKRGRRCWKNGV